jgi:hypothetical protein
VIFKNRYLFAGLFGAITIFIVNSCGDDATGPDGGFEIYGRVVYRALLTESPFAEFYLFHDGRPVTDGLVIVDSDTIPPDSVIDGRYTGIVNTYVGDTLAFNVITQYGGDAGSIIIPDTVAIIQPRQYDTLYSGIGFSAVWNRDLRVAGYYAHLENQEGLVADVNLLPNDTVGHFSGQYLLNYGVDRFWVETLSGDFDDRVAPNGMNLPRGVVGAAGNYREVYIQFSP